MAGELDSHAGGDFGVESPDSSSTMLRRALAVLAMPAESQVRANGPGGCVACDLITDFDVASQVSLQNDGELQDSQRVSLKRVASAMESLKKADCVCFDNAVLDRPAWQIIRELAAGALSSLGWSQTEVPPFVEIKPGVWHRPPGPAA